jgi:C-terminal processing protease CtpA/Prc
MASRYNFIVIGSRAWITSETFVPRGQANGIWEKTGIIPDMNVPTRWHQFTESDDPALAKAVELLKGQKKKQPSTVS